MSRRAWIVVVLAAAPLAGCGPQPAPTADVRATADEDFNALWDSAVEVLRQYRFNVDRADRRSGLITTFPVVGRSWFEFWRADAATPRDVLEGSLHTIYRQAAVSIRRAGPGTASAPAIGRYLASVEVRVRRSDRQTAQLSSASEAYEMFLDPGALVPEAGGEPAGAAGDRVDLGRDENLEKILQERINALAAKKLTIYPRE